jgi:hypothetical protein
MIGGMRFTHTDLSGTSSNGEGSGRWRGRGLVAGVKVSGTLIAWGLGVAEALRALGVF